MRCVSVNVGGDTNSFPIIFFKGIQKMIAKCHTLVLAKRKKRPPRPPAA